MGTQKDKNILEVHEIETKLSEKVPKVKQTFSKEQLLSSKKFIHQKDVLNVVLKSSKTYTLEEVESLIEKFMKGEVN